MQPTYFASFLLGENSAGAPPTLPDGLEVIAKWIFENKRRELTRPPEWPDVNEPCVFPKGERIQLLKITNATTGVLETIGVRFEHPDLQSRIWRTDTILTTVQLPEPAVRFAVTVAAGDAGDGVYAPRPPSSRPRIVREMMDAFGARERYPLTPTFLRIGADEAARFAGFLLDPERTIPLVFVSCCNHDNAPLCNPAELAAKLVGIAYVCVAGSTQLSRNLADHIDNRLNAYDGTIRVYWPRMTETDPPYRHRFWTSQQLWAREWPIADEVLRIVASASITRRVTGLVRWEDIERERTLHALQGLKDRGEVSISASDEWFRQYERDLEALDSARKELEIKSNLLLEHEEEVRQWKQSYLQALRSRTTASDETVEEGTAIEDAKGAIVAATDEFGSELEIVQGRVAKEAFEFEEPELLYAALKWLATTYRDAKMGTRRCSDLDKSCREICQFRYNAHQSDVTMGMYAYDYEVSHGGKKVKLREHIGYGTSTEPRHTVRLAFFFEEERSKVVVGYIGQHQATRKSN